MIITTERLQLLPLTVPQLQLWIENLPSLEKELECIYCAEPMKGAFLDIVKNQFERARADAAHYMFHSFWFLVRTSDRVVVGAADFKDIPNESGEVEIGYGLGKEFEHNGYMTEAVRAMCEWVLNQEGVDCVLAETYKDGFASQNVLKRCGFVQYEKTGNTEGNEDTFWWKLTCS